MICCDRCRKEIDKEDVNIVKTKKASLPFVCTNEFCDECYHDILKFIKVKP